MLRMLPSPLMLPTLLLLLAFMLLCSATAQRQPQPPPPPQLRTPIRRVVSKMQDNPLCGYIASIGVGTPPQQLDLLMDTGSANVFFGGSGCRDPKLGPCSPPLFAAARSSSFNASGGKYDMDEWCAGQLGTDSLAVAPGAVVRDQTFGLCSSSSILQPPSPGGSWYGGIFGLGMRALEQQSAQIVPPLTLLKQQGLIAKELFAVALGGHHPDDTSSSGGGEIHWGFTDTTMYHGNLTWHPMVKEGEDAPDGQAGEYVYYKVDVDAISLGGSTVQSQAQIMTDTGAVGIYPPSDDILNALHKLAPVAKDCSNRDSLPDLALTIGECVTGYSHSETHSIT